eukprot:CAMPEP_0182426434 /NCGR_PEP_ID=MMETSP1167-20130531/12921_1 /TAXON_ID=2988 /ORGANISM="Mallomonas Sp, Strain CCMP3275" /LENGTH=210 /DNA_ID=CAMNT_0024607853 /DNA_START=56 /DNA_END=688 /DNA_ORIENTATION=-
MIKAVVFACALASAAAFVPARTASRNGAIMMAAERSKSIPFLIKPAKLDGTTAGDEGFDPLGLSNIEELGIDLYWMREAELKHCRVAMLATFGLLMQEIGVVFPGNPHLANQVDAFWEVVDKNPNAIGAAFVVLGIAELFSGLAITEGRKSGDRAPGDFSFNPFNLGQSDASKKDLALKEVRNGRLAMWAAAGILMQEATTSKGALEAMF